MQLILNSNPQNKETITFNTGFLMFSGEPFPQQTHRLCGRDLNLVHRADAKEGAGWPSLPNQHAWPSNQQAYSFQNSGFCA